MESTKWVQFTDKPYGFGHNGWHFIFGLCLACDGIVSVLSLGLITTNACVKFMESNWQAKLFDHDSILFEKSVNARVQTDAYEDVKQVISEALGIPIENILDMGPSSLTPPKGTMGPPSKKVDWN